MDFWGRVHRQLPLAARPARSILHGSHWRLDGIGSLKLMDRFLAALCAVVRIGVAAPLDSYGLDLTPLFTPSLDEISNAYPNEDSTPPAVKRVPATCYRPFSRGHPRSACP